MYREHNDHEYSGEVFKTGNYGVRYIRECKHAISYCHLESVRALAVYQYTRRDMSSAHR